jgi:hypothetical protein
MKITGKIAATALAACVLGALAAQAADPGTNATVKLYTLKTCIISGEKLGEMGAPYVFTNSNRQVKLCCKACLKEFDKDPTKYLKKIDEEEAKAKTRK